MDFSLLVIYILLAVVFFLIGILAGLKIKNARAEKYADASEDKKIIAEEIRPIDPFPITTALDQKNDLDIKRSIRKSTTPLLLGPTGGLHSEKIRSADSWLRT